MLFDRKLEAFMAADRILTMVESAGIDLNNPYDFLNSHWTYDLPYDMQWNNGASRLVIWDEDYCDYVIKVALCEKFEKFNQHEVEVYEAAVKEGLADNFAWCTCYSQPQYDEFGEYVAPGVYIMEYVDCDEDAVYDSTWKHGYEEYCAMKGLDASDYSDEQIRSYDDWNCGEEDDMVLDYIESSMSDSMRKAFCLFMMKWWITDIHYQNVGFVGNRMVMVDYAGWNW